MVPRSFPLIAYPGLRSTPLIYRNRSFLRHTVALLKTFAKASTESHVVLITGANQGIGFFIAQVLSQSKITYNVIVGARNLSRGNDAVAKLKSLKTNNKCTLTTIQIDLDSHQSIATAVEEVAHKYGRLDVLVNNAGIGNGQGGSIPQREDWRRVFETNVIGTADVTNSFLPLLQKSSDAKIIVMSSGMGSISMVEAAPAYPILPVTSPYTASKAAINMVLVEWAKALKNVRLWGVDPGLSATGFAEFTKNLGRDPREGADVVRQCIEGERDDCVGKVVFQEDGESGVRPW